jgi:murein L,D-transpeptidase YafK
MIRLYVAAPVHLISIAALSFLLAACATNGASVESFDMVRVVKSERKLQLVAGGVVKKEFKVALGSSPHGPKQKEGDGKTPEGHYVLDYKNSNSAFYKSIHISYPNADDIARTKPGVLPGGQIMIHGQKNGFSLFAPFTQLIDWTNGCVALSNTDMDEVWKGVTVGTPIEIIP